MTTTTGGHLCVFVYSGVHHIFWCVFPRPVYPMLPVSQDCPFLIAPSVFSNDHQTHQNMWWTPLTQTQSYLNLCLSEFCFTMIGRADIEGSKSNVAMNAWLPQPVIPVVTFLTPLA